MEKKVNIFKIIFAIWGICVCFFVFITKENIIFNIRDNSGYVRLIELFLLCAILMEILLFKYFDSKWSDKTKIVIIFLISFIIRVACLHFSQYIPTNDFKNYFEGACYFLNNGFSAGLYSGLEYYRISEFGAQSIINGLLLSVFSPTLLGMQVLNAVYTSGICVCIYTLGRKVNSNVAILGAIIYTFYPISIVSTQITTNVHGATFFLLLGVYLFENSINITRLNKRIFSIAISSICFVVSNFYHPSVIIILCSLVLAMVIIEIKHCLCRKKQYLQSLVKEIRGFKGRFIITIAVIMIYEFISIGCIQTLERIGYIETIEKELPIAKVVVGLNQDTGGGYSESDYTYINSLPKEVKANESIKMIKERLQEPVEVINLMINKTKKTWFESDNYFYFYTLGFYDEMNNNINATNEEVIKENYTRSILTMQGVMNNLCTVDIIFVNFIWILAIIGIFVLIIRKKDDETLYSFLFIPIGWMIFIAFTEMQSRYRYQSMPTLVFLAALGIDYVYKTVKTHQKKN